ncbi:hypothetical protein [Streptomyces sp. JJ36]|uniref:hypothetical protein n=1 Tax=Streptomyces sp. JJ36 TaxID=2736645 RepID=UPI001F276FFA|nr:hypothetical protein [Streptomyces sp. JJ36]MCF6525069.1 hypothetical protein [Streptomyces sp. JJ36]
MRGTAVVLAATLLAGGCGAALDPGPAGSRLYPFDSAVYFTAEQNAALHAAEGRLTERCMRRHGFTYRPGGSPADPWEPDDPYGLLEESEAGVDGYRITPRLMAERGSAGSPRAEPSRGDRSGAAKRGRAWERALLGSQRMTIRLPGGQAVELSADGCAAKARDELYGERWDRLYYVFQALSNQVITRVGRHPDVRAAQRDWSRCMAADGYAFDALQEAQANVTRRVEKAAGRGSAAVQAAARHELNVASADARCQQEAGMRAVFRDTQKDIEHKVLGSHGDELERLRSMRDRALSDVMPRQPR